MSDHELHMRLIWLLRIGLGLGVLILFVQICTLTSKWYIRRELVGYLRRSDEIHDQTAALLDVVRGWGESGRVSRKEAAVALTELARGPTREELAKKIDDVRTAVPEATAAKVIEKMHRDGDSGTINKGAGP